jgi:MGT family glycosyltransferase
VRALFTLLPTTGSLHPLVPVAQALARAGHEVAWCSAASFRADAEATGFPYFAAGLDWHGSDPLWRNVLSSAAAESPAAASQVPQERVVPSSTTLGPTITDLFAGVGSRRMAPEVVSVARNWGADLIIRESLEFSGCAAAEVLGLPHASVAAESRSALDQRDQLASAMSQLRASLDLPEDPAIEMLYRYLHLCFSPPRFDGLDACFPPTAHFLQHTNTPRPGEELPRWWANLPPRPTVLASLGTVWQRTPGIIEAILAGLRDEPVNLVVAIGRDRDPASVGPQPGNVHLERYVPQTLLLPHCSLFVTHGGFNSVKESLSLVIPMVVVPIGGDQLYSAERAVALGLAQAVGPEERTPERIRSAVRTVLNEPAYRAQAQAMQHDMLDLPAMEHTVALLERLATERLPLMRAD